MKNIFKWGAKLKPGDWVTVLPARKNRDYVPGRNTYTGRLGLITRINGCWGSRLVIVFFSNGEYFWFEPDELKKQKEVKNTYKSALSPGPGTWPRE